MCRRGPIYLRRKCSRTGITGARVFEEAELGGGEKGETAASGAAIGSDARGMRWIGPALGSIITSLRKVGLATLRPSWNAWRKKRLSKAATVTRDDTLIIREQGDQLLLYPPERTRLFWQDSLRKNGAMKSSARQKRFRIVLPGDFRARQWHGRSGSCGRRLDEKSRTARIRSCRFRRMNTYALYSGESSVW